MTCPVTVIRVGVTAVTLSFSPSIDLGTGIAVPARTATSHRPSAQAETCPPSAADGAAEVGAAGLNGAEVDGAGLNGAEVEGAADPGDVEPDGVSAVPDPFVDESQPAAVASAAPAATANTQCPVRIDPPSCPGASAYRPVNGAEAHLAASALDGDLPADAASGGWWRRKITFASSAAPERLSRRI